MPMRAPPRILLALAFALSLIGIKEASALRALPAPTGVLAKVPEEWRVCQADSDCEAIPYNHYEGAVAANKQFRLATIQKIEAADMGIYFSWRRSVPNGQPDRFSARCEKNLCVVSTTNNNQH